VESPLAGYDTDLDDVRRRVTTGRRRDAVLTAQPGDDDHPPGPFLAFLDALGPDSPLVVLDQAYTDFCDDADQSTSPAPRALPRLVVLRTFSKIAGSRPARGLCVASVETIDRFNRVRAPTT